MRTTIRPLSYQRLLSLSGSQMIPIKNATIPRYPLINYNNLLPKKFSNISSKNINKQINKQSTLAISLLLIGTGMYYVFECGQPVWTDEEIYKKLTIAISKYDIMEAKTLIDSMIGKEFNILKIFENGLEHCDLSVFKYFLKCHGNKLDFLHYSYIVGFINSTNQQKQLELINIVCDNYINLNKDAQIPFDSLLLLCSSIPPSNERLKTLKNITECWTNNRHLYKKRDYDKYYVAIEKFYNDQKSRDFIKSGNYINCHTAHNYCQFELKLTNDNNKRKVALEYIKKYEGEYPPYDWTGIDSEYIIFWNIVNPKYSINTNYHEILDYLKSKNADSYMICDTFIKYNVDIDVLKMLYNCGLPGGYSSTFINHIKEMSKSTGKKKYCDSLIEFFESKKE